MSIFPGTLADFVLQAFYGLPYQTHLPLEDALDAHAIKGSDARRVVPSYIRLYGRERRALSKVTRATTSPQRDVLRARIVLMASLGMSNASISAQLACNVQTVRKWRERFVLQRLEGLRDLKRTGRPAVFSPEARHQLFALAVSDPPDPYSRWTVDLLREAMKDSKYVGSIGRETLSLWLRSARLKPHRVRSWLNSKDPDFQDKMKRIVDLYLNPPTDGKVICVDELTGLQALERKFPTIVARNAVRYKEFEYIRHGTVKMIASFHVHTGAVMGKFVEKNDSAAFIEFLKGLLQAHPEGKIYLILDNGSSHTSRVTTQFLSENPRFVPVFTPTHASWLNQIEIWFSALKRKALQGVSFRSVAELQERICNYVHLHNAILRRPYKWTYTGQPLAA